MPSSRGSFEPTDQIHVFTSPALANKFFIASATWEAQICDIKLFQNKTKQKPNKHESFWQLFSIVRMIRQIIITWGLVA